MQFSGGRSTGEKLRPVSPARLAPYAFAVAFVLAAFAGLNPASFESSVTVSIKKDDPPTWEKQVG
jgi:hypothetical protein